MVVSISLRAKKIYTDIQNLYDNVIINCQLFKNQLLNYVIVIHYYCAPKNLCTYSKFIQ